jgi:hypothetical protein
MSTYFAHSSHMPCPECGASVTHAEAGAHVCEPERLVNYRMFQLRGELELFEGAFGEYLDSPQGHFAQWLAEHERRGE